MLISKWNNGGTQVRLYSDGTKIRRITNPAVPPVLPEQMDLKITDWCDAGCAWCHEGSTTRGQHAEVEPMLALLSTLPAGTEIAIGGGDPLSHPQFAHIVRSMRTMGLVPSVTVNGRHLERHLDLLKTLTAEKSVFGVGVSFYEKLPEWDYEHLVVHMIAGVDDPTILDGVPKRKILVLGYKHHGRGIKWASGQREINVQQGVLNWKRALFWLAKQHHISFDTLAITQLSPQRLFKDPAVYSRQFMGEEGAYSMYVDAVKQQCAVSSYSNARSDWSNMKDMFDWVRSTAGHSRKSINILNVS